MPSHDSPIRAGQANAKPSTGPRTPEGQDALRASSSQPGPTVTKVLPEREAEEVQRRTAVFANELDVSGEVGVFLCRLAAIMSARVERCQLHEIAMQTERVRKAIAEIVYPPGIDPAGAAKLREEASQKAVFDPSPEATLARKYMISAERSFYRALKELRIVERAAKKVETDLFGEELGSNLPDDLTDEEFDQLYAGRPSKPDRKPVKSVDSADFAALKGRVDVPIAIGKRC